MAKRSFPALVASASALTFVGVYSALDVAPVLSEGSNEAEQSVYYRNCAAARAAGAAPLYRGKPGYRSEMDGDLDGVACEPYRGY